VRARARVCTRVYARACVCVRVCGGGCVRARVSISDQAVRCVTVGEPAGPH